MKRRICTPGRPRPRGVRYPRWDVQADRRPQDHQCTPVDSPGHPARGDSDQRGGVERGRQRADGRHRGHRRPRPAAGGDRRPVFDSRRQGGARLRAPAEGARRALLAAPARADADLLREAADGGGLEGVDQRSRSRRELPHQQGPADRAAAAARHQRPRPVDGVGVPRYPDPAAPGRPDVVGRHRRPHDREPGSSRAGLGVVDAGRLQERHRRQHAGRPSTRCWRRARRTGFRR